MFDTVVNKEKWKRVIDFKNSISLSKRNQHICYTHRIKDYGLNLFCSP